MAAKPPSAKPPLGDADVCRLLWRSEPIFGKGMRQSIFQWKKGFSVKRGDVIQWIRGLVRISTGKAIQWRGSGHSLSHRSLKTKKLLSSFPSENHLLSWAQWTSVADQGGFANVVSECSMASPRVECVVWQLSGSPGLLWILGRPHFVWQPHSRELA